LLFIQYTFTVITVVLLHTVFTSSFVLHVGESLYLPPLPVYYTTWPVIISCAGDCTVLG